MSRRPEAGDNTTVNMKDHEREWLRRYEARIGAPSANTAIGRLLRQVAPDLEFPR